MLNEKLKAALIGTGCGLVVILLGLFGTDYYLLHKQVNAVQNLAVQNRNTWIQATRQAVANTPLPPSKDTSTETKPGRVNAVDTPEEEEDL